MSIRRILLPVSAFLLLSGSALCQSTEKTQVREVKSEEPAVRKTEPVPAAGDKEVTRQQSAPREQRRSVNRQKMNNTGTVKPVDERKRARPRQ